MAADTTRKLIVVIADDDLDDHYFIKEAMHDACSDFHCHSVYNGIELMELLGKAEDKIEPDLIVMDLNMPLLNGFGALAQIRAHELLKKIPVYILSTSGFDYDKQKAMDLGADEFYTKPNNYSDLKDIIREICNKTLSSKNRP